VEDENACHSSALLTEDEICITFVNTNLLTKVAPMESRSGSDLWAHSIEGSYYNVNGISTSPRYEQLKKW